MTDTLQSLPGKWRAEASVAYRDGYPAASTALESAADDLTQALAASGREAVGEVCDMKYSTVRFYKERPFGYLQPGTKLYIHPPAADVVAWAVVGGVTTCTPDAFPGRVFGTQEGAEKWRDGAWATGPWRTIRLIVHPEDRTATTDGS